MKIASLVEDREVRRILPSQTALQAARAMSDEGIGSLLVSDESGRSLGIFTERDLMRRVVAEGRDPQVVTVEEVMTRDLYTTTPERLVTEVRREMRDRHIRHVPVIEDGEVVAVLSMRDLTRADLREKRQDVQDMTNYIRGDGEPRY